MAPMRTWCKEVVASASTAATSAAACVWSAMKGPLHMREPRRAVNTSTSATRAAATYAAENRALHPEVHNCATRGITTVASCTKALAPMPRACDDFSFTTRCSVYSARSVVTPPVRRAATSVSNSSGHRRGQSVRATRASTIARRRAISVSGSAMCASSRARISAFSSSGMVYRRPRRTQWRWMVLCTHTTARSLVGWSIRSVASTTSMSRAQ